MDYPDAIRKHDGRAVAFDAGKLALSVARAAVCAAKVNLTFEEARRLGHDVAQAVGSFLVAEGKHVALTADIRARVIKALRDIRHEAIADAYIDQARVTAGLLWRTRVVEPGTPYTGLSGFPWDRRRLFESLCAAGVGRDPAGEVARDVERRVVTLGQDRISPALIHALACLILAQRNLDTRAYKARRISFSAVAQVPIFNAATALTKPLPASGPALEAFWLQAVHSLPVARAVQDNLLSLTPFPHMPQDAREKGASAEAVCTTSFDAPPEKLEPALAEWWRGPAQPLWLRADSPGRIAALARALARLAPASGTPSAPAAPAPELNLLLKAVQAQGTTPAALPVTLNLAGLLVREALHDQSRALARLTPLVMLAAQAHREREEYFGHVPMRGRLLPVCVAGLWNAAAWLQGEGFDAPQGTRSQRGVAAALLNTMSGAIRTLRNDTGMELVFSGDTPACANQQLWERDREFFRNDGVTLDPVAAYDAGPEMRLAAHHEDLGARVDFAVAAARVFDEPLAAALEAPLANEQDAAFWQGLLEVLAQAGVVRLRVSGGGTPRAAKLLLRGLRAQLSGLPLFAAIDNDLSPGVLG